MLTKSRIALSALLAVSFASAALAGEPVENRIGDRFPVLEQTIQPRGADAYAAATHRGPLKPFTAQEKAQFDRPTALLHLY